MGEKARYLEIASEVSKKNLADVDAKALVETIAAKVAAIDTLNKDAADPDTIDEKDPAFVGICLCGSKGGVISNGELTVDTSVTIEEPRLVVEDEEEDESQLRELWGD